MGFGNLISADILAEKRLKKVHHDEKKEKKDKPEERNVPAEPSKAAATAKGKAPVVRQLLIFSLSSHNNGVTQNLWETRWPSG